MAHVIGMDLGAAFSRAAVFRAGSPALISCGGGQFQMPGAVSFLPQGQGEPLTGQKALQRTIAFPHETFLGVRCLLENEFASDSTARLSRLSSQGIVPDSADGALFHVHGEVISPEEISSFILRSLKNRAEEELGEEVTRAVLTCPAHFGPPERRALLLAGRLAGLDVLQVVSAQSAEALLRAWKLQKRLQQSGQAACGRFAVADLGADACDVSIFEITQGESLRTSQRGQRGDVRLTVVKVLASAGESGLGTMALSGAIAERCRGHFESEVGIDLTGNAMALRRLWDASEKACEKLMAETAADVSLPFLAADDGGVHHLLEHFAECSLDELAEASVSRVRALFEEALDLSSLSLSELSGVFLLGGMSRVPCVRRAAEEFWGRELLEASRRLAGGESAAGDGTDESLGAEAASVDAADGAGEAAMGAALWGAVLSGLVPSLKLEEVSSAPVDAVCSDGTRRHVLMRHDPIPCQKSETFDRGWDSDGTLTLDLAEARDDAESEMTSNFARLHVLRPAGGPPRETEVRLEVDASGMIHASAREVQTNRALEVRMSWKGEAEKDLRSGV